MPKHTRRGAKPSTLPLQNQFRLPVALPEKKRRPLSPERLCPEKNLKKPPAAAIEAAQSGSMHQTDLFSYPFPPLPTSPRTHFTAEELRLSYSPPQHFTPQITPDSWLYLVSNKENAQHLLSSGVHLAKTEPLLLIERNGVCAWRDKLAEDPATATASPCVLRLRRSMVADMLEPDPDHSAEFSAECYLLTGAPQEQDR
ncbi:hypothetical protein [Acetobacter tropicalis]|uniref:hypothetical protein n=1 Tax=Acetobacter tropicalis TaxID=104102 RepID=UPI0011249A6E|nr:hypothetical protein [Acetobacter tropicalis]